MYASPLAEILHIQVTRVYTDKGPVGLLENKKAFIVIASGGVTIGSEVDFASTYLKHVLSFIGIKDVTIINANDYDPSQIVSMQQQQPSHS